MKRTRFWRRAQNEKIINKRLNILKNFNEDFVKIREYKTPGFLKKWNFTCSCACCKMTKTCIRVEENKKRKELNKFLNRKYEEFYF